MADRKSGEVERDSVPFELQPCASYTGTPAPGHYCTTCEWSFVSHERAIEQERDVRDEREGR